MNEYVNTKIKIEMTGKDDANVPWNIALAGFAGAGKTLFASTATSPLFLFFAENPRIKSVRNRYVPHVKLVNTVGDEGGLVMSVQDKVEVVVNYLHMGEHDYKTLVVDTGDELFQAMKEGRRIKQGGEFNIGDWGWIGDAYREVVTALIDLPLNLIVLYHVKNTSDGEDGIMRELMLQGLPKDEAPSWFDIVGAIDTYEVVNEEGDNETRRTILTQPTRLYPWLKDHSGNLPRRFDISRDFVGDFDRMMKHLSGEGGEEAPEQQHQVLAELSAPATETKRSGTAVPTPMQLQEKKAERAKSLKEKEEKSLVDTIKEVNKKDEKKEEIVRVEEEKTKASPETSVPDVESDPEPQQAVEEKGDESISKPAEADSEVAAAEDLIQEELGATEVVVPSCDVCGAEVDDADLRALTEIRFHKVLCRPHFKEALEESRR